MGGLKKMPTKFIRRYKSLEKFRLSKRQNGKPLVVRIVKNN